jgi:archaellum component FlaG (FlaF/FlaG flagellin family)
MLGIQRKAISVLVVAALFVSIPSVLGKSTLLNIPKVEVYTNISSASNIQAEEPQGINGIVELQTITLIVNYPPIINGSDDIEYYYGQTGNSITWIITDDLIDEFSAQYIVIKVDGILIQTGVWHSGSVVEVNVDGLEVGTHIYEITADDGLGGTASDSVNVIVLNVVPIISQPEDIEYDYGQTGNNINWVITDDSIDPINAQYIVIKIDGIIIQIGAWYSGSEIEVNVDGLEIGTHIYEITADDGLGGTASDSVNVIVSNGAPIINQPEDIEYDYGQTGNNINWVITDDSIDESNAQYIVIIVDGIIIQTGAWYSGSEIEVNVDGLEVGTHIFEITADDGLGGTASDSVNVIVSNVAPIINQPEDIEYDYGQTDNTITWIITDDSIDELNAQYIVIKVDGIIIQAGSWRSGSEIEVNVDGLEVGTHIYEITAEDGLGGTASDSVNVIVNTLSGVYEYIDFKFEELEAYIDENLCFFVKWIVGFTVDISHYCIEKAYDMYESGHIRAGTMYSYFSQALLHITDFELEIFSYFKLISDEDKEHINVATEELRVYITALRDIYI